MCVIRRCILFAMIADVIGAGHTVSGAQYSLTTLASFNNMTGANPTAGVIADASGNLFGTTGSVESNGIGAVFEVAAGTHTLTTWAAPGSGLGGLIADASGNLFGTTLIGGDYTGKCGSGCGTVFEVAAGTHAITTLASFNFTNGAGPSEYASLVADSNGNLYGTTGGGGTSDYGTVFEVAADTHALSALASFDPTNGRGPEGTMLADSSGNLYGTTVAGGAGGYYGMVFELAAGSHSIMTLASFDGTNGYAPYGGLITDASGNLYGTTFIGGANGDGNVFEVAAGTHALTTLAEFNGANGHYPQAGLIADTSGNLFGTTLTGGVNNKGTVFELPAGSHSITTLVSFNGTNGALPSAALIADSSGNLYGTTEMGGANNKGTVFELSRVSDPGSSQDNPILPNSAGGAPYTFNGVFSGSWFDPPLASSFVYTAQPGTLFSQILDFPTGFSTPFTVSANGSTLGQFIPGQSVSFPQGGVTSFTISGINPLVDLANPRGFPLRIGFTTPTGSFTMTAVPVAGDYNGDGVVDSADYTVWRDTLGSTTDLRANGNNTGTSMGVVDQADYDFWKAHFGMGDGSGSAAAVPEPASFVLFSVAGAAIFLRRRRR